MLLSGAGTGRQLVLQGAITDIELVFEETESELLQLCGVCDSVELYPDLNPGTAVLRRSQLLDAQLLRDGLPPIPTQFLEGEVGTDPGCPPPSNPTAYHTCCA